MKNCPTCGRAVTSIFDHVDVSCENWPDRGEKLPHRYRNFDVSLAYVGYQYTHIDYDGPEDRRAGVETTLAECYAAIDEWHDEND